MFRFNYFGCDKYYRYKNKGKGIYQFIILKNRQRIITLTENVIICKGINAQYYYKEY